MCTGDRLTPRLLWEHVKSDLVADADGYFIFDDTVIDKRYAKKIALAKKQYSGNAGGIVNGIAIVTCVYVNPKNTSVRRGPRASPMQSV